MEIEELFVSAAEFAGANAVACFLAGLIILLLCMALTMRLLQMYPLRHAPDQHTPRGLPPVLITRFGIGFLLIVTCGFLFAELADEIGIGEELAQVDLSLSQAVQQYTAPSVMNFFSWITHLGDTVTLTVIGIVVAATLFIFRQRWLALGWSIAVAGNGLLNMSLKAVFERVRPLDDQGLALIAGWSFPSGHASGAVVAFGMLSYVLIRNLPKGCHMPIILLAATVAYSVGCSRIFLQYHYASDVLAGFASGTAWLAVCISTMELARWRYVWRRPKP
jgi:undecaprenyl-diphosphatase